VKRGAGRIRARPAGATPETADTDTLRLLKHWRDAVPDDPSHTWSRMRPARWFGHCSGGSLRSACRSAIGLSCAFSGSRTADPARAQPRAGVMEPTTFGALKAMESRGYIARRKLAGNRRKIRIFLTRKGRALKNKLVPLAEG
jgi:hypothetical protein